MKNKLKIWSCISIAALILANCGTSEIENKESTDSQEKEKEGVKNPERSFQETPLWVYSSITINASKTKVWKVFQNPEFAKTLGAVLYYDVFIESDWELNSEVYYKEEPNTTLATGKISKLIENELAVIDYDFDSYVYQEKYKLKGDSNSCTFEIHIGPYKVEYEKQKVIWKNWLNKVKEISEKE